MSLRHLHNPHSDVAETRTAVLLSRGQLLCATELERASTACDIALIVLSVLVRASSQRGRVGSVCAYREGAMVVAP